MSVTLNSPIVCPIIIDRVSYLQSLEHTLEQLVGGNGHTVLVSGEAGIGKSRLVAETKARATQKSVLLAQGNCFEPDRSLPYAPFIELLRTFFATSSPQDIREYLGSSAPEILKLLPELAGFLTEVRPSFALDPEQEKRRLFHALTHFLFYLSSLQPLLLVIEDMHWSDTTSLDFLLYLARRLPSHPILLILTYRSDEVSPDLQNFLAELDRERLSIEWPLTRLTLAEVGAMLSAIFGLLRPVHHDFLKTMYTLTEGNPFFIEEVLRALIATGDIYYTYASWDRKPMNELNIPRSVQTAVQRRSEKLSHVARSLLELAAVAGRRFDFVLLQHLTERDEEALLQLIKELIAAQLVIEETADGFAFRHALTRQAIYVGLLARERKRLHQRIAETLVRLYEGALESHLGELSYHFYHAEAWTQTLDYARLAGERAQALYAPHAAIEHFTRSLMAAGRLAIAPPKVLYRLRGQAYETLGDFERAQADYQTALHLAHAAADSESEWQALLDLGQLWAGRDYAQTGIYYQRAFELAQIMDKSATLAHSLNRMGNWHLNIEQPAEARRCHEEALAIFQQLAQSVGIAETLDLLGMTHILGGDLIQSKSCYEQAIALFRERDDRQMLVSSLVSLTLSSATYQTDTMVASSTNVVEVALLGEQGLKNAAEIGWRSGESYALIFLGFCLGPQGEYTRGLALSQRGLVIAEEIEHRQWMTAAHCALGALYRDLLAIPQAQQHLEQALALAKESGSLHWVRCATGHLVATYILQHNLSQATAILDETLDPETPMQTMGQRLSWCARGELALALGDAEQALNIAEQLISSAAHIEQHGQHCIPRLAKLRGAALATLSRKGNAEQKRAIDAEVALRAALDVAQAQSLPGLRWRIHADLCELYRGLARQEEAAYEYNAARLIIEKIASGLEESLRDNFLQHAVAFIPPSSLPIITPAQAGSPRRSTREAPGRLTVRELEVATLIAQGKTNREIADILIVGERTVETHVGNILGKLGFTSRSQIAAWAVEKGVVKNF